jgi:hypothetical protein
VGGITGMPHYTWLNFVKMTVLFNDAFRSLPFLVEMERLILKLMWNCKKF